MKKFASLFVIIIIFSFFSLTSCNSKDTDKVSESKKLKHLTFITNNSLDDQSYNDLIYEGLKKVKDIFSIDFKVVENQNKEEIFETSVIEASENKNTDIIIICGMNLIEYAERHAYNYPNKKYIYVDVDKNYEIKSNNAVGISFKQSEGEFLVGAVAAFLSKTENIGFIGGKDINIINDFLLGYIQGAKYINPNIKIISDYVGDFNDLEKSREITNDYISKKVDVIHPVAGRAGVASLEKASEMGIYTIGVDVDQYNLYKDTKPRTVKKIVTSFFKHVDIVIFDTIKSIIENKQEFKTIKLVGLKEGAIGLVENDNYKKYLTSEQVEKIDLIKKDIIENKIDVKTYYDMDKNTFNNLIDSVKP